MQKFIKDALLHPVDLAVATPSSLLRYQREERLWLSDLSHLVIDEADTLFDRSFIEETLKVVNTIKLRSTKPSAVPVISEDAQVTVVGATLSQPVVKKIESLVPVRLWLVLFFHLLFVFAEFEESEHQTCAPNPSEYSTNFHQNCTK